MRGGLECFMFPQFSHSVFASNRNSCRMAFGLLRVSSACFGLPSIHLCHEANVDGYVHIADEVLRSLLVCMDEGQRDYYMFLHAASAKRERCLAFWLHHGADLSCGTASHPDWIALEWACAANASPKS